MKNNILVLLENEYSALKLTDIFDKLSEIQSQAQKVDSAVQKIHRGIKRIKEYRLDMEEAEGRIGEEVDEHLAEAELVAQQVLREAGAGGDLEALVLGPGLGEHHRLQLVEELRQAELGDIEGGLAAFDLAHV